VAKLEAAMKEASARGARKQVRHVVLPLRREVLRLRRKVREAQPWLTRLRQSAGGWERMMNAAPPVPAVSEEEAKVARLSPRLVLSLRTRLGLSPGAPGGSQRARRGALGGRELDAQGPEPGGLGGPAESGEARSKGFAGAESEGDSAPGVSHSQASSDEAPWTGEAIARRPLRGSAGASDTGRT